MAFGYTTFTLLFASTYWIATSIAASSIMHAVPFPSLDKTYFPLLAGYFGVGFAVVDFGVGATVVVVGGFAVVVDAVVVSGAGGALVVGVELVGIGVVV